MPVRLACVRDCRGNGGQVDALSDSDDSGRRDGESGSDAVSDCPNIGTESPTLRGTPKGIENKELENKNSKSSQTCCFF